MGNSTIYLKDEDKTNLEKIRVARGQRSLSATMALLVDEEVKREESQKKVNLASIALQGDNDEEEIQ
jgi:hypothetical protein